MIANECKWLQMNVNDCEWIETIVSEWELLWMNFIVKGIAIIVNEWVWVSLNECECVWMSENICEGVWRIVNEWKWIQIMTIVILLAWIWRGQKSTGIMSTYEYEK